MSADLNSDRIPARVTELGRTIAARRKDLGVTQEDLAALTGLSTRSIGQLELGQTNPRLSSLLAVLTALGLDLTITTRSAAKSAS